MVPSMTPMVSFDHLSAPGTVLADMSEPTQLNQFQVVHSSHLPFGASDKICEAIGRPYLNRNLVVVGADPSKRTLCAMFSWDDQRSGVLTLRPLYEPEGANGDW
jgi:hypothetical protein